jgi:glycerophosphoryl diester phosphodiesterase
MKSSTSPKATRCTNPACTSKPRSPAVSRHRTRAEGKTPGPWLADPAGVDTDKNEVAVGQGTGKVILQTFEKNSLELLQKEMPQVPKILLLWVGEGNIEPASNVPFAASGEKDKAAYYADSNPRTKPNSSAGSTTPRPRARSAPALLPH